MTEAHWRRALPGEIDAVEAVLTDPQFFAVLEAVPRDRLEEALTGTDRRLFVWAEGAEPMAFAYLSGCNGPRPKLEEFATLRRGAGVGGRALPALVALMAAEKPGGCLWLHVVPENAVAIRLYRRCGFGRDEIIPAGWTTRLGVTTDLLRLHHDL
ncbi:GNAT family N-acetyltransferase [Oceanicella sp. SM1341]|uniref:GNAT family N-acetyltransferase n=1 Tax=Oceanicella sp. SM1341 TaxID=1548889 RepID=UPI0013002AAC|nr:GNAT family N-acetyltransferase [Oceanicella sp. SM1341]